MKKGNCISSIYSTIYLVPWSFKLSKALTILFTLFRNLTEDFSVDSFNFHQKQIKREEPVSLLAWLKPTVEARPSQQQLLSATDMLLLTTEDSPTLPQGENSYCTCQHANMFGMFSYIHWQASEPTNKKMGFYYIEARIFKKSKQLPKETLKKLGNKICKVLQFYKRHPDPLRKLC